MIRLAILRLLPPLPKLPRKPLLKLPRKPLPKLARILLLPMLLLLLLLPLALDACSRPRHDVPISAPELSILYNAEEQPSEKHAVMQIIQAQLRAKGIPVRLDPVSNTLYNERLAKGDFACTLNLWYVDYNDPEGYLTDFYSKAGYRTAKYDSPQFDRLYLAGLRAPTEAEKLRDYTQALDLVDTELPWIPLYSNQELYLVRRGYEGYSSNAYQYYDYRRVAQPAINAESDTEVETLDPALAYDVASKHLVTQSYEGLVALDEHDAIVPALASSWELSPAQDVLTFQLRTGVTFHRPASAATWLNARPLDSEDVRASFERMLKSTSPYTYIFNYVQGVDAFKSGKAPHVSGFRTPDASTFALALTQPFPTMLPWLLAPAAYILPRELPANYDFSQGSVGTGPFELVSWDGVLARFIAHPGYWVKDGQANRPLPLARSLTIRVMKDPNTALAAFRARELDILNVPLAVFPEILDGDGRVKATYREYGYREVKLLNLKFLAFNMQLAPWGTSLDLRRRVLAAIDREGIVRLLFRRKATVQRSDMPEGFPGFDRGR